MIRTFNEILAAVQDLEKKKVVVASAEDDAVLEAVKGCSEKKLADFILVGDQAKIEQIAKDLEMDLSPFTLIDEPDPKRAAYESVKFVAAGMADVLMKGQINTALLLRAVLDKEFGLRSGRVLSHVAVLEVPSYDQLLMITDGGMNILPTLEQKCDILHNAAEVARALRIEQPKAAALAAVETVQENMLATVEAALLAKMSDRGQLKDVLVDGPLAFDNAISRIAAKHKNIESPVAGQADILLVPNIETGNALTKGLVYFAKAKVAGLVVGAKKPIVVTSRSDTYEAKILSVALGVLMIHDQDFMKK